MHEDLFSSFSPGVWASFPESPLHSSTHPLQCLPHISEVSLQIMYDLQIILNKVLLVSTRDKAYIGMPVVTNAAVHAVVEEQVCPVHVV
jgi:hypothetical protein